MQSIELLLTQLKKEQEKLPYYIRFATITSINQSNLPLLKSASSFHHCTPTYSLTPSQKPLIIL